MKRGSTLFLKLVVILLGLAVLGFCIFVLPNGVRTTHWNGYRPLLLIMYGTSLPFFIALYQILKLLSYIDHNKAFSEASIKALRVIKYCGVLISAPYAVALPYLYRLAQLDDAPGVMLMGLIFSFAPLLIALIAGILQKVLQNAIAIKSENELTV